MSPPDIIHRRLADALTLRHGAATPMGHPFRFGLQRSLHDGGDLVDGISRFSSPAGSNIPQTIQTFLLKSLALGAQREAVYRLILGQAGFVAAVGIVVGLVCSIPAARLLRGLLFGVQSWDVPTLIGVAMVLGICALLTSYLPARRAASMNPVEALRAEYYFLCRQDSISLHSEGLWKRLTSFYMNRPRGAR